MSYKVCLEVFEGPLDLLLYLIREEELDIHDIPIAHITRQYLEYMNLMELMDLEIAGEFLVMAATLMQIKSRMLLPPDPSDAEENQEDPRADLVRRLLEYKAFKEASGRLRELEEKRSDFFPRGAAELPAAGVGEEAEGEPLSEISLFDLVSALARVLKNLPPKPFHEVIRDEFTVSQKVDEIRRGLKEGPRLLFHQIFSRSRNRYEAITTFLALLELIRLREVTISQQCRFGEIEILRREETRTVTEREVDSHEFA